MSIQIAQPFSIFLDVDGTPLNNGYVYIGTKNLNPETNPVACYWDAALTLPAAQPIRTTNGAPSRNGTPSQIYTSTEFSITVRNSKSALVFYKPNGIQLTLDSSAIVYVPAGIGAVTSTAQNKLREVVSVKDFGAVGDGATDDTAAIQAAIDHLILLGQGSIHFPSGDYVVSAPVGVNVGAFDKSINIEIYGNGPDSVITSNFHNGTAESGMLFFTADEIVGINLRRIYVHHLKFNANLKRGSAIFGRLLTASKFDNLWIGGFANDILANHPSIYLKNCAQTAVVGCVLNHNPNVMSAYGGPAIRMQSTNYGAGLGIFRSKNIISDNVFGEQIRKAIVIDAEVGAAQGGNVVSNNSIFYTYGNAIEIINCDSNTISGNTIDEVGSTSFGLLIDSSSYNTIIGNAFIDAGTKHIRLDGALTVAENCIGNVITGNSFVVDNVATVAAVDISDINCVNTTVLNNSFAGTFSTSAVINLGALSIIGRQSGYSYANTLSPSLTAGAADTTPTVFGGNSISLQAATTYTMFDDGVEGQLLFVRGAAGSSLVSSGTLRLAAGSDYLLLDANSTMLLYYFGGGWWEISRNFGTPQNRGTAAPATGFHARGEVVWNSSATAGGFAGWICVTAGTPGTWKTFGVISV